jgi:hypothetical protein
MAWSPLPVATPFLSTGTPPGTFSRSVSIQTPLHVRYLENNKVEKFYNLFLRSRRALTMMESSRLMLRNGQEEIQSDTTSIPFVTSVLPVEADGITAYQPIFQRLDTGHTYTTKATLLQDGSYRLSSRMEFTYASKVERYRLVNEDTTVSESRIGGRSRTETRDGVTVQVPSVHTFRAYIPDIVIPDGMSLLVAFPGGSISPESNSSDPLGGIFMLITPRKVDEHASDASEDMHPIQDEWAQFWSGDVPTTYNTSY